MKTLSDLQKLNDENNGLRDEIKEGLRLLLKEDMNRIVDELESNARNTTSYGIDECGMGFIPAGHMDDIGIDFDSFEDLEEMAMDIVEEELHGYAFTVVREEGDILLNDGECVVVCPFYDWDNGVVTVYNSMDTRKCVPLPKGYTQNQLRAAAKQVAGDGCYLNVVEVLNRYGLVKLLDFNWGKE